MPSNVVDDRIVKIEFDNEGFEDGVSDSLNSLDKFEKSLDGLEKSTFGEGVAEKFGDIQESIDDTDMSPLSDALDNVGRGFSALETIAVGALLEIGAKVADLGMKMVSSLSVDPIAEGFQKYTASSKDVKAIMNQTGLGIEDVTEKLDALSWYSDATSYNYSAMVSALKSFSSQGIDIEDSIPMIMGLGNSLSYAGLAAEEASSAFDIYSKAIGRGYMDLKQWQRLNNMGASTMDLKERYMEAAYELGQLKKVGDGAYRTLQGLDVTVATFDSTLGAEKGKWLTTEVMQRVLKNTYGTYSNDLYAFSQKAENAGKDINQLMDDYEADYQARLQAFVAENKKTGASVEELIGDFESENGVIGEYSKRTFLAAQEARTFSEAVNAVADAASSAWRRIFENVFGNAIESTELWSDFSSLVYDLFMGPLEGLSKLTSQWKAFGGRDDFIQGIYNLAGSLSTIIDPIKEAFNSVFDIFGKGLLDKVLEISKRFKDWAFYLQLSDEQQRKVHGVALALAKALKWVGDRLKDLLVISGKLLGAFTPLLSIIGEFVFDIIQIGKAVASAFSGKEIKTVDTVGKAFDGLRTIVEKFSKSVNKGLRKATVIIIKFIKAFKDNKIIKTFSDTIASLSEKFKEIYNKTAPKVADAFSKIAPALNELTASVGPSFISLWSKLVAVFDKIAPVVTNAWNAIKGFAETLGGKLLTWIEPAISKLQELSVRFEAIGKSIIDGITKGFDGKISGFLKTVGEFAEKIIQKAKDVLGIKSPSKKAEDEVGKPTMEGWAQGLRKGVQTVLSAINETIGAIIKAVVDSLPEFTENIKVLIEGIAQFISGSVKILLDAVGGLIVDLVGHISGFSNDFLGAGRTLISNLATGIGGSSNVVITSITNMVITILKSLAKNGGNLYLTGQDLIQNFANGAGSKQPTLAGKMADILGTILDTLAQAIVGATSSAFQFMAAIANGITENAPILLDAAGRLIHEIAVFMNGNAKEDLLSIISNVGDIIVAYVLAALPIIIKNIGKSLSKNIESLSTIFTAIGKTLDLSGITSSVASGVTSVFNAVASSLNNLTKSSPAPTIKAVGLALLEMAAAIFIISKIDAEKISLPLKTLAECLGGLLTAIGLIGVTASLGKTNAMASAITALSLSFAQISVGLAAFALAAKVLGGVDPADIEQAVSLLKALGVAVGVMAVIAAIAAAGDLESFKKSMNTIVSSFVSLSIGIGIFALAAKQFQQLTPEDMEHAIKALQWLGGVVAAFAVVAALAKNNPIGTKVEQIAFSMAMVSGSLALFGVAARSLSETDFSKAIIALEALGVALGAMTIMAVVLDNNAKPILQMSVSLGIIAASLLIFAKAIEALSAAITLKSIGETVAAIGILVGALTLIGALHKPLTMAADVLNLFASTLVKVAVGVGIAVLAFDMLVLAIVVLGTLTTAGIEACIAAFGALLIGIAALEKPIKNLLLMILNVFIETIKESWATVKKAVDELLPDVIETLKRWAESIRKWLKGDIKELFLDIGFLFETLIGALIAALFKGIGDGLVDGIEGMVKTIKDGALKIADATVGAGEALDKMFSGFIENIIKKVTKGLINIAGAIADSVGEIFDAIVDALNKIADKIEENGPKIRAALDRIKNAWKAIFTKAVTTDSDEIGKTTVNSLADGITKHESVFTSLGKSLWAKLKGAFNKNAEKDSGIGVTAGRTLAREAVAGFDDEAEIDSPSGVMKERGDYWDQGFAIGVRDNASLVEDSAKYVAELAAESSDIEWKFGQNLKPFPVEDMKEVGRDLISNMKDYFKGSFIEESEFAVPLSNKLSLALKESFKSSSGETSSAVRTLIADVKKAFNDSLDGEDIVIKPVVDLSNVESGAVTIKDLLSGATNVPLDALYENAPSDAEKSTGTTITFTQNNYSPKELSRIDIYRQTKNQLSLAKGVL